MPDRKLALVSSLRPWLAGIFVFGAAVLSFHGQEDEDLPPPPAHKKDGVQITFLPPPMQGVISMGIYDGVGTLVRTLHREATEKDFVIGVNGFITRWDGKNDGGEMMPPAKYQVRGWMVGDLQVEGVAFHGNDWVKEDGPRFVQALRLIKNDAGTWHVVLRDDAGEEKSMSVEAAAPDPAPADVQSTIEADQLTIRQGENSVTVMLAEGEKPVKASTGFGGQVWAIVETPTGREVRSFSPTGEFLRRLAYRAEEPAPFDLGASTTAEVILLLERNEREQRFRALAYAEPTPEGSAWKTMDQKRILVSDSFASIARDLGRAEPPTPEPLVRITSKRNPLLQSARTDVFVQPHVNAEGAFLATKDGLPLLQITEAKGLKWAALVREGKALLLFQGDGAAVEEFKIGRPDNLMSFDAGEYTLKK